MFLRNPQVVTVGARIQLETMCVFKPLISSINNYLKNKFLFVFCCLLEFFMALGKPADATVRKEKVAANFNSEILNVIPVKQKRLRVKTTRSRPTTL
jgi:hypothetical protein